MQVEFVPWESMVCSTITKFRSRIADRGTGGFVRNLDAHRFLGIARTRSHTDPLGAIVKDKYKRDWLLLHRHLVADGLSCFILAHLRVRPQVDCDRCYCATRCADHQEKEPNAPIVMCSQVADVVFQHARPPVIAQDNHHTRLGHASVPKQAVFSWPGIRLMAAVPIRESFPPKKSPEATSCRKFS